MSDTLQQIKAIGAAAKVRDAAKITGSLGIDKYFSSLLNFRDSLHLTHLYQGDYKYSTHIALEEAYLALLPIVDGLIEGYTGVYYPPTLKLKSQRIDSDLIGFVTNCYENSKEAKLLFVDGWIHSDLDDIQRIIAMLLYKLKYTN